jgi:TrpR-related protein YerC/YecD
MRTSDKKINSVLKSQITKTFVRAICDFKTPEELEKFLKDFFTDAESETFVKRLAIAYWLKKGRSYANIRDNLKVSSATISSVQNMMDSVGIKLALKNIEAEEWANQWAEKIKKFIK